MSNLRFVVALAALAACGGSKPTAKAGGAAPPLGGAKAGSKQAPVAACPTGDALKAKLLEAFKLQPADLVGEPSCVAGHFPAPAWDVQLWFYTTDEAGEREAEDVNALLDPSGKILAQQGDDIPPAVVDSVHVGGFQAADFDGDGIDEIVSVTTDSRQGYATSTLNVDRVAGGKWTSVLDRVFSYDDSAAVAAPETAVRCEATWAITPGSAGERRKLTFTPKGASVATEQCVSKAETWTLEPGAARFTK